MEEEEYVDDSWERIKRYEGRYSEFENASRRLFIGLQIENIERMPTLYHYGNKTKPTKPYQNSLTSNINFAHTWLPVHNKT